MLEVITTKSATFVSLRHTKPTDYPSTRSPYHQHTTQTDYPNKEYTKLFRSTDVMSQKKENFKLKLEKLWSRGFMDDREFYEWLDFYSYPLEKTNFFMRRQLYPTFGSNVIFLGKIELVACLDHQKKGFERTIQSYRASLNERLRKDRFFKRWGRKLK